MKNLLPVLLLASFVAVSGCAATTSATGAVSVALAPSVTTSLNNVGNFTLADLQNADKIALAQTPVDTQGDACYKGLEVFVQSQQATVNSASGVTVSGAFSVLEATRAAASSGANVISSTQIKTLENACGPLVIDIQNTPAVFLANLAALGVK